MDSARWARLSTAPADLHHGLGVEVSDPHPYAGRAEEHVHVYTHRASVAAEGTVRICTTAEAPAVAAAAVQRVIETIDAAIAELRRHRDRLAGTGRAQMQLDLSADRP